MCMFVIIKYFKIFKNNLKYYLTIYLDVLLSYLIRGTNKMLISTIAIQDKIQKENLMKKVDRLCSLHKCSIIDLLVLSIDVQASNKIKDIQEN